jgi:hypothetical protein
VASDRRGPERQRKMYYMAINMNGNELTSGVTLRAAQAVAQLYADEHGETVYVASSDGSEEYEVLPQQSREVALARALKYARDTAADSGVDLHTAARMMLDEPQLVMAELGISRDDLDTFVAELTSGSADTLASMGRADMLSALASEVGDDGTGDLGVIVDHARPTDTVADLVEVVLEARADAAAERAAG